MDKQTDVTEQHTHASGYTAGVGKYINTHCGGYNRACDKTKSLS